MLTSSLLMSPARLPRKLEDATEMNRSLQSSERCMSVVEASGVALLSLADAMLSKMSIESNGAAVLMTSRERDFKEHRQRPSPRFSLVSAACALREHMRKRIVCKVDAAYQRISPQTLRFLPESPTLDLSSLTLESGVKKTTSWEW